MNLENICDGDLYELQKIPKMKFTEAFSKKIVEKWIKIYKSYKLNITTFLITIQN